MLQASSLTYQIGGKTLVSKVDLALRPGRLVAIIGPNGAGKSTLLRLLSGELRPTSGAVELDGRSLRSFDAAALARRRAVVPQATALSFPFTAREVVLLGATVPGFGAASAQIERMAMDCLRTVGLVAIADRFYTHLSGGEKQRVHIARALLQLTVADREGRGSSSILMLDEPTASLDLAHQGLVLEEARRQAEGGRAVLAVLHDLNLAAAFADELVLMCRGEIAARGSAQEVINDALLSRSYGCEVRTNTTPDAGIPFVLPYTRRT
ncbi:Hemin import ATP-binding protein HmuV [Hyphomicrobium sp. 1Nfss2.1]|uniref:heme ABC transporter ATP-binding protein n=1 Tax=Hyphomicrobium sp. 1Nfss2.1 TaxID=3413936 RepID=UPI003C7A0365